MADKRAVIFDFGSRFTKIGFSQCLAPRAIIPSRVFVPSLNREVYLDDLGPNLLPGLKTFIENIYLKYLGFNVKERKVVVCESIFTKPAFRKAIIAVLLEYFEIPALLLAPIHLMALVPKAISTGLVIDVGYNETTIMPIVEGRILTSKVKFVSLAGKAINSRIRQELLGRSTTVFEDGISKRYTIDDLDENTIENIKVKACFFAPFERGQILSKVKQDDLDNYFQCILPRPTPKDFHFHVDAHRTLVIPGPLRESVAEVLFELSGELTVATAVLEVITNAPIDARKALASNIVIIGGTSMLPGFLHRLKEELCHLVMEEEPYKTKLHVKKFLFHANLCKANYVGWLGTSIFSSTDALNLRAVGRDAYLNCKHKSFLDWNEYIVYQEVGK